MEQLARSKGFKGVARLGEMTNRERVEREGVHEGTEGVQEEDSNGGNTWWNVFGESFSY